MNIYLVIYSATYALFSVVGAALIKSAINAHGKLMVYSDYVQLILKWKVIFGFAIIFGSSLVLFKALSEYAYSKVIPISIGINFVLTALVGYMIFNENLSITAIIAMSIILFGIILLSVA